MIVTRRILLITLTAGLCALICSNQSGPVAAGNGNHTGSGPNPAAGCGGPTCHAPNNANTSVAVVLTDTNNTTPVTSYIPGKIYRVRINGTNASALLPRFGFQLSTVRTNNILGQAGNLSTGGNTDIALRTLDGLQIIEHIHPISGVGAGITWSYASSCFWTAPPAGTGQVTFFATLNAVNANGYASGDQTNIATLTIDDGATVIKSIAKYSIAVYPNPADATFTISSCGTTSTQYIIRCTDEYGRLIHNSILSQSLHTLPATVSCSDWLPGRYFLQISDGEFTTMVPVVKQ